MSSSDKFSMAITFAAIGIAAGLVIGAYLMKRK
jgi:hypothetical protein